MTEQDQAGRSVRQLAKLIGRTQTVACGALDGGYRSRTPVYVDDRCHAAPCTCWLQGPTADASDDQLHLSIAAAGEPGGVGLEMPTSSPAVARVRTVTMGLSVQPTTSSRSARRVPRPTGWRADAHY